jgi:hypothetical protein
VEGKVFKAPNGKVTVYGRLTGSAIETGDIGLVERLAEGSLSTGRNEATAAAGPRLPEPEEEVESEGGEDE